MANCDPKTLPAQAACLRCIDRGQLESIDLFLLWTASGDGVTPAQAAAGGAPFRPFTWHLYLAAKAYLFAVITGSSTVPSVLASQAACFFCIPKSERKNVETYLYALSAGVSTNAATLSANSGPFRGIDRPREVELYFLSQIAGMLTPQQVMAGAKCFQCLTTDQLQTVSLYLLCQGLAANIIPPGSTYGPTLEFDIAILPNTYYRITWGANDVSATVCGQPYTSGGVGSTQVFYSGPCTLLKLFGNAAGTTVTAMVIPVHNVLSPPSGFTWTILTSGLLQATWDAPPAGVSTTELWTSTDGVNYALSTSTAAPGTKSQIATPSASKPVYAKVRWIYSSGNGGFASALNVQGRVADWAARVVTNGGAQVSANTITALSTFVSTLITNSLDSMMLAVLPIVPDNLIAAITPLYKNAGNDPWTNNNFVAGDLTINGLVGNGTTKFLNTGVTQNSWNAFFGATCRNSAGIALYFFASNNNSEYDFGCGDTANALQQLTGLANQSGTSEFDDPLGTANALRVSAANAAWTGYLSGQRISATDARLYKANSGTAHTQLAINNGNAGAAVTDAGNMFLFALNETTTTGFFSTKRISFCATMQGLTSAQDTTFFNAVQALRTALGGGFV